MKKISRKAFLVGGTAAAVTLGGCLCTQMGRATLFGTGTTPEISREAYEVLDGETIRIDLDHVPELASVGGAVKISDSDMDDSLIIARTSENDYVATSIFCTHRGVEVEYRHGDQCLKCASLGGSTFGTNGDIIRGFAKSSLRTYTTSCRDGILEVHL